MAVIEITKENFESEIKESKIPVIIDFWASWCGPCQMMGPVFEELSNDFDGRLKFAKINVDNNPDYADEFEVQGIPALIVVDKMDIKDRIVGFAPKEVLKGKVQKIIDNI